MDRLEKIKELYLEIEKKMMLISLLMGRKSEFIDEGYIEQKEKLGLKLGLSLDFENKLRYNRIINPLVNEYFFWRRDK